MKLKSRKLWVLIGGVVIIATTALSGEISWSAAVSKAVGLAMTYLGAQAAVDMFGKLSGE